MAHLKSYTSFCRVDFVGGTTDLWPLYCHLGSARVINMAIPVTVNLKIEFEPSSKFSLTVVSGDLNCRSHHNSLASVEKDLHKTTKQNPLRWLQRLAFATLKKLDLSTGYWNLELNCDAPPGSGLGGSSVIAATVVKAIHDRAEKNIEPIELHNFIINLEAAEIEKPAGEQDSVPALWGGLVSFKLSADAKVVTKYPTSVGRNLGARSALIHTGKPHHSGINNWDVFKKYHEGNKSVRSALAGIRDLAEEMHLDLEKKDLDGFIEKINLEWNLRKKLSATFDVPVLRQAWQFGKKYGAVARKACGAGGGGALLLVFPSQAIRDEALTKTLPDKNWLWIKLSCEDRGLFE